MSRRTTQTDDESRKRLNAYYQGQINANTNKINKINNFVNGFEGLIEYVEKASDKLKSSSEALKQGVIINGLPYDKGEFLAYSNELKSIVEDFRGIMKECREKVEELQSQNSIYRSKIK